MSRRDRVDALQTLQLQWEAQNEELRRAHRELEKASGRYSDLYNFAPVGYLTLSRSHLIAEANVTAGQLLGMPHRQLVGKPFRHFIVPEDRPLFDDHIRTVFQEYTHRQCELRLKHMQGAVFWGQLQSLSLDDDREEGARYRTVLLDVTDRKRAEEALRASETRFSGILEVSHDAIISIDERRTIRLFNRAAERLFGYTREDVIGRPLDLLLPDRFHSVHNDHLRDFAALSVGARRMGERLEIYGRKKNGKEFPAEAFISKLVMNGETIMTVALRDVAERKRAEEKIRSLNRELERRVAERTAELRSERDLQKQYLDVAGVILLVIGSDQMVTSINKKGCEVLGYEESEIVGQNWFDHFLPERLRDEVRAAFDRVMAGDLQSAEYYANPILCRGGEERTIMWHNSVLRDQQGRIHSTLSSGMDMTEKLQLEQRIRQAEKLAAVGQLSSGLAHEIGTPLNVIAGRAELMIQKMAPSDPMRENLGRILSQIERITKIVNQLLDFARSRPLEARPVRLGSLIREILSLLEHQIRSNRIAVDFEPPDPFPEIAADPDQIQQVFLNVLINAIQAMPAGGTLSVRFSRTTRRRQREDPVGNRFVRVEISDTGSGIPPEQISRVFDPFFTTKDIGKGTGLGLAISSRIVQSHGGWMNVKSIRGDGSLFNIYLPVDRNSSFAPEGDTATG
jgi:PAS domain S-box-containing protein